MSVEVFDWLSKHLMYYLYIDECDCVGQFNTMSVDWVLPFSLKYFIKSMTNK